MASICAFVLLVKPLAASQSSWSVLMRPKVPLPRARLLRGLRAKNDTHVFWAGQMQAVQRFYLWHMHKDRHTCLQVSYHIQVHAPILPDRRTSQASMNTSIGCALSCMVQGGCVLTIAGLYACMHAEG